jgi:hypothetical protein
MSTECVEIGPSVVLRRVIRERRTRKPGCYLVSCKYGTVLLISQRLPLLASYLNTVAVDRASRVSVPALYQICDCDANRVGGYTKNRWRVRFVPLEEATACFEAARAHFERALILGARQCYQVSRRPSE